MTRVFPRLLLGVADAGSFPQTLSTMFRSAGGEGPDLDDPIRGLIPVLWLAFGLYLQRRELGRDLGDRGRSFQPGGAPVCPVRGDGLRECWFAAVASYAFSNIALRNSVIAELERLRKENAELRSQRSQPGAGSAYETAATAPRVERFGCIGGPRPAALQRQRRRGARHRSLSMTYILPALWTITRPLRPSPTRSRSRQP
jgi:hypothetical protein